VGGVRLVVALPALRRRCRLRRRLAPLLATDRRCRLRRGYPKGGQMASEGAAQGWQGGRGWRVVHTNTRAGGAKV